MKQLAAIFFIERNPMLIRFGRYFVFFAVVWLTACSSMTPETGSCKTVSPKERPTCAMAWVEPIGEATQMEALLTGKRLWVDLENSRVFLMISQEYIERAFNGTIIDHFGPEPSREERIVEFGKYLSVQYVVWTSLEKTGDTFIVYSEIWSMDRGKILATAKTRWIPDRSGSTGFSYFLAQGPASNANILLRKWMESTKAEQEAKPYR